MTDHPTIEQATRSKRARRQADDHAEAQAKRDRRKALPLKRYSITIEGYGPETFDAPTPSAARWRAFQAFRMCSTGVTFKKFLGMASVLHLGHIGARSAIIHDPRQIDIEAVLTAGDANA